jgi:hypothetical protein
VILSWQRALVAGALVAVGCGARSELSSGTGSGGPGGAPSGGAAGVGGEGPGGEGGGGAPPEPCLLVPVGSPVEVMAFADRSAIAPSLAPLADGFALQALASGGDSPLHPDIQIERLRVGPSWPEGIEVVTAPLLVGPEAHGWAEMARAPGDRDEVALAWYGDPGQVGRTSFRVLDAASWSPAPVVDISFAGSVALALEAGAGTGPFGVGYAGDGYALAWREESGTPQDPLAQARVAVLDPGGAVLIGPHPAAGGVVTPYPGFAPAIAWTGETYLLATALGDCTAPGCPAKLIVERVRPASGDAIDDSGVELVWGDSPALRPTWPTVDSYGGRTWMAWFEGDPGDPLAIRSLRLVALDAQGNRLGEPITVTDRASPASRARLTVGEQGVLVAYAEEDFSLPVEAEGRGRVIVHQLDLDGTPLSEPIPFYSRVMGNYGPPHALATSDGAIVAWSGRSRQTALDVVYLARLSCAETPPCHSPGDCPPGEFCDVRCCDEPGFCKPVPDGCFDECSDVVACDGDTHCSACTAQVAAGVDAPEPGCP